MHRGIFFQKELIMGGILPKNVFMGKIYGEGLLYMDELMIR